MEKITLEELMKEKIYSNEGKPILCTTKDECEWEGNFKLCYYHLCITCPHYVTPTIESGSYYVK